MDAAFLRSTVSSALTSALAEVARTQPEDPVEFLGNWLLRNSEYILLQRRQAEAEEAQKKHREEEESKKAEIAQVLAQLEADGPAARAAKAEKDLVEQLETCAEVNSSVLASVAATVQRLTNASSVYIAERLGDPAAAEEGAEDAAKSPRIKYLATAGEHQEYLTEEILPAGSGVTWKCWVLPPREEEEEPEEEEMEEDADGNPVPKPKKIKPEPELPVVHISNVLTDPSVHFFRVPRAGAFVAQPLQYPSVLHSDAFVVSTETINADLARLLGQPEGEEGGAPAEEEGAYTGDDEVRLAKAQAKAAANAAEAAGNRAKSLQVPEPKGVTRSLALCADTMGQNRDFSPSELAFVKSVSTALKAALLRTERAVYEEEYKAQRLAVGGDDAVLANLSKKVGAAIKSAKDKGLKTFAAMEDDVPEDRKAAARFGPVWEAASSLVKAHGAKLFAPLAARKVQPRAEVFKPLQAAWVLVAGEAAALGDPRAADPLAVYWPAASAHVGEALAARMAEYNAESPSSVPPAGRSGQSRSAEAIKAVLGEEQPSEDVLKSAPAAYLAYFFALSAVEVRDAAKVNRERSAAEEAARIAAEAEAKAAAEAEAAAAAAAEAEAAAAGAEAE